MEGDLAFFIHFNIITIDRFVEGLLRSLLSKLAQHRFKQSSAPTLGQRIVRAIEVNHAVVFDRESRFFFETQQCL
jgi:hypothetical protein